VPGSTKLTAYNAVGKLEDQPRFLNGLKAPRSATFLAVIRFIERCGGSYRTLCTE